MFVIEVLMSETPLSTPRWKLYFTVSQLSKIGKWSHSSLIPRFTVNYSPLSQITPFLCWWYASDHVLFRMQKKQGAAIESDPTSGLCFEGSANQLVKAGAGIIVIPVLQIRKAGTERLVPSLSSIYKEWRWERWQSVLKKLWRRRNVCNRCLCSGFVIKVYSSEKKWETWLQKEGYKQKHPKHFLLYSALLNIRCTCFRPRVCCNSMFKNGKGRKKKKELICSSFSETAVRELSLVGSQMPALQ